MKDNDSLGDRMKGYESPYTDPVCPKGQPMIARLDGHTFSTFTKGLTRPYDRRLSDLMIATAAHLVEKLGAAVAYTQSDEITLAWHVPEDSEGEYIFGGRLTKVATVAAGMASAFMVRRLDDAVPDKAGLMPHTDGRAFPVPDLTEAYNAILWRQLDARKNAISMAAQHHFSHASLQGMHGGEMVDRLKIEAGVDFENYPGFFRLGTFVRRTREERELTPAELARIPEDRRPTGPVVRSRIVTQCIDLLGEKERSGRTVDLLFGPTA